ncbi:MAG: hypothetical protein WAW73_20320 [Rhodoferax sp.]
MNEQANPMPAYKSHKTVRAAKITAFRKNGNPDMPDLVLGDIGCIVSLLADWHQKHKPQVGGYLVQYEDGYQSFSPAKAFEEGYIRINPVQLPESGPVMRDGSPADPEKFVVLAVDLARPAHQQRVVDEKEEVSTRLAKLLSFFQGPIFPTLDEAERSRLRNQARFMDGYAAVLKERIAAFKQPAQTPVEHQPV